MSTVVFVLAPHRSYTSVLATMIGRHPSLYGLPETNLFVPASVGQWWQMYRGGRHPGGHGLIRALAEVLYGAQSPTTVEWARDWLRRRPDWPCTAVFEVIRERVAPLGVVEKSPRVAYSAANLDRLLALPEARFLHVTRHPYSQGVSMLGSLTEIGVPRQRLVDWLDHGGDPQDSWLQAHRNILQFQQRVPAEHWLRLTGEQAMADPGAAMQTICRWLGLSFDPGSLAAMLHPEQSPFATPGPPSARLGLDAGFLADPALHAGRRTAATAPLLTEPLPWDPDRHLEPAVTATARELGYR